MRRIPIIPTIICNKAPPVSVCDLRQLLLLHYFYHVFAIIHYRRLQQPLSVIRIATCVLAIGGIINYGKTNIIILCIDRAFIGWCVPAALVLGGVQWARGITVGHMRECTCEDLNYYLPTYLCIYQFIHISDY